ncbi:hypothetical protein BMAGN_0089 [Bifidobacterium magnum]|uniref:DUF4244 domain-containing protein n=2 Tax=Bifidobacterium magnum TaxID=1692 RepID=A0A087BAU1_9BIFI|nr:hypothetical protein BMAGN_0089 [Bifidobacterium magnum]
MNTAHAMIDRNLMADRPHSLRERMRQAAIRLDLRMRALAETPERGAATAEYAVVLVAATGFAAVLVSLLKSDTVRTLLTNIVQNALQVG